MSNIKSLTAERYLDLSVLGEPLACVMHAYHRLPKTLAINSISIFGAGPIGALHALHSHALFPLASINIIEPDETRRNLISSKLPFVSCSRTSNGKKDLVIVATSSPEAQIEAIQSAGNAGIVILFSGINHKDKSELPTYEHQNLEEIHRNEEIKVISNNIRLIGSSGYHPTEIDLSLNQLLNNPDYYGVVQTTVVNGLDSKKLSNIELDKPAIVQLLSDHKLSQNDLKILFRHNSSPAIETRIIFKDGVADVENFDIVIPPSDDEMLVRVLRSSICQTDRRVLLGLKKNNISNGIILGHEGVGIIQSVGKNIDKKLIGKVCTILPHYFPNKDDPHVRMGMGYISPSMEHLGIHVNGCFSTLAVFPSCCIRPHDHGHLFSFSKEVIK